VYGFDMTPFKEVVLGRQRKLCEPEIMILKPEQLLSEPQVVAEFDLKEVYALKFFAMAKFIYLASCT